MDLRRAPLEAERPAFGAFSCSRSTSFSSSSGIMSSLLPSSSELSSLVESAPTFDDQVRLPTPPTRTLLTLSTSQLSAAHTSLDTLTTRIRTIRALSARLAALHPNDLSTPTLALDLRDALLDAAARLRDADGEVLRLWEDEERVRTAWESGGRALGLGRREDEAKQLAERREKVDGIVRRLARRAKDVRREARAEARDRRRRARREDGEDVEPDAVGDYLEVGAHEFTVRLTLSRSLSLDLLTGFSTRKQHLLTKDVVHASRFVVDNPFSILVQLLDGLEALKIPRLVRLDTFYPPDIPL